MTADDMTSQDGVVIGDDLVEALGFEPISADTTEADLVVIDDDETDVEVVDQDSEVATNLEDEPVSDDSASSGDDDDAASGEAEVVDLTDGVVSAEESAADESPANENSNGERAKADDTDTDAGNDADTVSSSSGDVSVFGAVAPSRWQSGPSFTEQADDAESADDAECADDADVADASTPGEDTVDEIDGGTVATADAEANQSENEVAEPEVVEEVTSQDSTDSADGGTALDGADSPEADAAVALHTEEEAGDVEARDRDAVVFFDNNVDANTAPLPSDAELDLNELESEKAEERSSEINGLGAVEIETTLPEVDPPAEDVPELDLRAFDDGEPVRVYEPEEIDTPAEEELEVLPPAAPAAAPTRTMRRRKLRARKSRRVVRHIDPWSVLTFSVLFHLCFFAALLLASVLVWNAALAAGTIENIENFVRELGDYETFEINSDQVFKAAALIAGMLTLASSVLVVLLTVVFNLISDLVGGIRVTVIEEETVRIEKAKK